MPVCYIFVAGPLLDSLSPCLSTGQVDPRSPSFWMSCWAYTICELVLQVLKDSLLDYTACSHETDHFPLFCVDSWSSSSIVLQRNGDLGMSADCVEDNCVSCTSLTNSYNDSQVTSGSLTSPDCHSFLKWISIWLTLSSVQTNGKVWLLQRGCGESLINRQLKCLFETEGVVVVHGISTSGCGFFFKVFLHHTSLFTLPVSFCLKKSICFYSWWCFPSNLCVFPLLYNLSLPEGECVTINLGVFQWSVTSHKRAAVWKA